jgi:hypothetical protein
MEALPPDTTVEFLTYLDPEANRVRRFVIAYVGESRHKIEISYPEPIQGIVDRVLTEISNAGMSNAEMEAPV